MGSMIWVFGCNSKILPKILARGKPAPFSQMDVVASGENPIQGLLFMRLLNLQLSVNANANTPEVVLKETRWANAQELHNQGFRCRMFLKRSGPTPNIYRCTL